jgi:hypothetical protein
VRKHALSTFVINPLVHIYQKEKIAAKNRSCERAFMHFQYFCNHILFSQSACVPTPHLARSFCCSPPSPRCLHGATCVVNIADTTRRFKCQCRDGYYGNRCQIKKPKTCLDYWSEQVKPISGKYSIVDANERSYEVFCDFDSEEGMAWTLFESFDMNHASELDGKPFTKDYPKNEHRLNWKLFRLPKSLMLQISSHSTFWRATCSYPVYGVDFRDYFRVRLSTVNPVTYESLVWNCSTVDYFDIKGTSCVNCTQIIYQHTGPLALSPWHSRERKCTFDTSTVEHKCENGEYARLLSRYYRCSDPKYRCSEKATSTTEFWFGAVKEKEKN